MFTGIIQGLGTIISINDLIEKKITIDTELNLNDCKIGSSICCDGICLTTILIIKKNNIYRFDVNIGEETVNRSTVKFWIKESKINIEKSLKFGDEIGGHIVYGHIDCIAKLEKIEDLTSSCNLFFSFDKSVFDQYKKLMTEKGSISVNGISLTIAHMNANLFDVSIIPQTYKLTNLSDLKEGDFVNIEFDALGKYIINKQ